MRIKLCLGQPVSRRRLPRRRLPLAAFPRRERVAPRCHSSRDFTPASAAVSISDMATRNPIAAVPTAAATRSPRRHRSSSTTPTRPATLNTAATAAAAAAAAATTTTTTTIIPAPSAPGRPPTAPITAPCKVLAGPHLGPRFALGRRSELCPGKLPHVVRGRGLSTRRKAEKTCDG
jgi:hypothetical protein